MSYNSKATHKIRQLLARIGIKGQVIPIMTSFSGWPDRLIILPGGKTIWVEIKSAKDRISNEQRCVIEMLRSMGHNVVLFNEADEDGCLQQIKNMI